LFFYYTTVTESNRIQDATVRPILYDQAKSMAQVAIIIIKVWRCQRGNDNVYIKGRTIKFDIMDILLG
jgi:hypothetical protein